MTEFKQGDLIEADGIVTQVRGDQICVEWSWRASPMWITARGVRLRAREAPVSLYRTHDGRMLHIPDFEIVDE